MARTLTRASQTYAPGTYGPFVVDGFTKNDVSRIRVTMTDSTAWPANSSTVVARFLIVWSTGDYFQANQVGGQIQSRYGGGRKVIAHVPKVEQGPGVTVKRNVVSATLTITVLQAITTAIAVTAE